MMRYSEYAKKWDKQPPRKHIEEFQKNADEELNTSNNGLISIIKRVHAGIRFSK